MRKNKFDFLQGATVNKIISILIAIFLWAYVIAEVNPVTQQTMVGIPVQLYNIESISERGLALSGEQSFTVNVVLEGKRRDMVQVSAGDVVATADLFGFGKGENTLSVGVSIPDGMSIVEIRPSKIKVTVEELVTAVKPVKLEYSGIAAEGFEPGGIAVNPVEVEVTGAESAVGAVSYIRANVDLEDLDAELKTIQIRPEPVDIEGAAVDNVKVSAKSINVTGRLLKTKEVRLRVEFTGDPDPLYEVKYIDVADTITIKGEASVLEGIDTVTAEPIDLSTISVTKKIKINPVLPEGVEVAEASGSIHAEIGVQAMANKAFIYEPDEIEVRGLDAGLNGDIKVEKITVTASGLKDIIEGLEKGDIIPYIDLGGQPEGVGNYQIYLECDKKTDGLISDPTAVYVIISKNSQ